MGSQPLARVKGLEPGAEFKFTLTPVEGYGEIIKEAVVELPKNVFEVDGKIDENLLKVGAMVPMADQNGNRLLGQVVAVAEVVTMDFNHPMAGKTLDFSGKIVDVRELTPEDLQAFAGGGCSCGEGECSDKNCDDKKDKKECGCGC